MAVDISKLNLLHVADAVAREKMIDRQVVLSAMSDALQKAARARYGNESDIRVDIDLRTGEPKLSRFFHVVECIENDATEMSLAVARRTNPSAELDDYVAETLPFGDAGRVAAQAARQVLVQRIRDAERDRQYEEFKSREGEIINGTVKRIEHGNVVVDIGRGEAIVRRTDLIPREVFKPGDRIRAYIYDVRREERGPQVFLSRTHPQFMAKLFTQEVPEIYDGIVTLKAVARDPGSRAKIAVTSRDSAIDPVGACVGIRGSRVQVIVQELQGEKIDIIPWSNDMATFLVNALQPAEVGKVILDDDLQQVSVVVPDEQLSLAIGRRGQNVRLASQLTGWSIDILTEKEESERRQKEFSERSHMFMSALDVDEIVAQLLVSEGFSSLEELDSSSVSELATVEGFDESIAQEVQNRARAFLTLQKEQQEKRCAELGIDANLRGLQGVEPLLVKLGENGIKSLEDLAGCSSDDLVGWTEKQNGTTEVHPGVFNASELSRQDAERFIMHARRSLGWISDSETSEVSSGLIPS
jgi:N utilization substance protein A